MQRYAEDERVWVITGNNFQGGTKRGDASYYFSRYNHVWGWATWRRAWKSYDGNLSFWPAWKRSNAWQEQLKDKVERKYWARIFDRMYAQHIDTWDYPWTGCVWYHSGLTATPNVNLVSNIGFGGESTHTVSADSPFAGMATGTLGVITHPSIVVQDSVADRCVFDHHFGGRLQRYPYSLIELTRRAAGKLYRFIKNKVTQA